MKHRHEQKMESLVIFSTVCLLKNCRMGKPHKTEPGLQSPNLWGRWSWHHTFSEQRIQQPSWLAPWALSPHQTLASWGVLGYEKKLSKNAFKRDGGTSLVIQWLRIHLPTQGKWVRSLVWGDPTCRRATKPMCHNHRSLCARTCAPGQGKLLWWEACAPNLKKVHMWVLVNKIFKNKYK